MAQFYFDATSVAACPNDNSENTVSDDSLLLDNKWTINDSDEAAFVVSQQNSIQVNGTPSNNPGERNIVNRSLWQEGHPNGTLGNVDNNPTYPAEAHIQSSSLDEADVPLLANGGYNSTDSGLSHCHSLRFQSTDRKPWQNLLAVSILCLSFMILEIVGGYLAGSSAVMTDAAHLLSDLIGFLVSLSAVGFSSRPATKSFSFGFFRVEVLGALVSTWIIWVLSFVFLYIAIHRLVVADFVIKADTMLIVSSVGVVINIVMGIILHGVCKLPHSHGHSHNSHQRLPEYDEANFDKVPEVDILSHPTNINVRAAFIHIVGDLIQSIGVVIAAILIKCLGPSAYIADPICTLLSSFLVLITTIPVLRDTGRVLLEGFPPHLDYKRMLSTFQGLPHVKHAHSLQVWSLTLDKLAMSIHLAVDRNTDRDQVLQSALLCARDKFGIMYSTIQIELYDPTSVTNCASCQPPSE